MRKAALAALLAQGLIAPGCTTFAGAADAGRRALVDGYVAITAPIQVPAMAGRDAWNACSGEDGASKAWLPVFFVGYALQHAGLSALHLIDLAASPIHLVVGNPPPRIYVPYELPMPRYEDASLGKETGELALYGVAGVGGAIVAWYFATIYLPHIFRWFF